MYIEEWLHNDGVDVLSAAGKSEQNERREKESRWERGKSTTAGEKERLEPVRAISPIVDILGKKKNKK